MGLKSPATSDDVATAAAAAAAAAKTVIDQHNSEDRRFSTGNAPKDSSSSASTSPRKMLSVNSLTAVLFPSAESASAQVCSYLGASSPELHGTPASAKGLSPRAYGSSHESSDEKLDSTALLTEIRSLNALARRRSTDVIQHMPSPTLAAGNAFLPTSLLPMGKSLDRKEIQYGANLDEMNHCTGDLLSKRETRQGDTRKTLHALANNKGNSSIVGELPEIDLEHLVQIAEHRAALGTDHRANPIPLSQNDINPLSAPSGSVAPSPILTAASPAATRMSVLGPPCRMVSASDDPVIVDCATAAVMNFLNRSEGISAGIDDDEDSYSDGDLDKFDDKSKRRLSRDKKGSISLQVLEASQGRSLTMESEEALREEALRQEFLRLHRSQGTQRSSDTNERWNEVLPETTLLHQTLSAIAPVIEGDALPSYQGSSKNDSTATTVINQPPLNSISSIDNFSEPGQPRFLETTRAHHDYNAADACGKDNDKDTSSKMSSGQQLECMKGTAATATPVLRTSPSSPASTTAKADSAVTLSASVAPRVPRRLRSPSSAWDKFSASLRTMGVHAGAKPGASYFDRRHDTRSLSKGSLLHRLVLDQARTHGKYIRFEPSMEVAVASCAESEIVDAVRVLAAVVGLRDEFIPAFPDHDSLAIRPSPNRKGCGTTEPVFDPGFVEPLPKCNAKVYMEDGVYQVYWEPQKDLQAFPHGMPDILSSKRNNKVSPFASRRDGILLLFNDMPIPPVTKFLTALKELMAAVQHPACKTFTFRRLEYLKSRFSFHRMFNTPAELQETQDNKHRDFYNVRKVDTHVHHSACMHQKHLLRFIRKKHRTEPETVVAKTSDGIPVTLAEIFEREVGTTAYDASTDLLNVHALGSCFHRFDIFNSKYNPFGQALLREVFLKTDNVLGGRFLAEITREVESDLENAKYQFVEWRVSIYGKRRDEWLKLARWVQNHKLSCKQVRWMIQIPRLYHVYHKLGLVSSFGDLLRNIFEPVFEAVIDPESHPEIFQLLLQCNGWDSVDDESVVSKFTTEGGPLPLPDDWVEAANPPYSYWGYYIYANVRSLNHLLVARGLRTTPFRPHCGEAGSISHLASMYLLADGINHGIMLKKSPVLQYLFYLRQIGLAVSPLSNNALFHDISKNPFNQFFFIGLNVSLSTDDPLMFHFTSEPLLEEYSCCAHTWKFSPVDLCELARNSILQSHFEPQLKRHWLGPNYKKGGREGNAIAQTNVADIRLQHRHDSLVAELKYLRDVLHLQQAVDELTWVYAQQQ